VLRLLLIQEALYQVEVPVPHGEENGFDVALASGLVFTLTTSVAIVTFVVTDGRPVCFLGRVM